MAEDLRIPFQNLHSLPKDNMGCRVEQNLESNPPFATDRDSNFWPVLFPLILYHDPSLFVHDKSSTYAEYLVSG
jgi:hypothetical protein